MRAYHVSLIQSRRHAETGRRESTLNADYSDTPEQQTKTKPPRCLSCTVNVSRNRRRTMPACCCACFSDSVAKQPPKYPPTINSLIGIPPSLAPWRSSRGAPCPRRPRFGGRPRCPCRQGKGPARPLAALRRRPPARPMVCNKREGGGRCVRFDARSLETLNIICTRAHTLYRTVKVLWQVKGRRLDCCGRKPLLPIAPHISCTQYV